MDKTLDIVASEVTELRQTTAEGFRKGEDQFAEVRAEMRRMEQNMYSLFALLFAKLDIITPPDLIK